MLILAILALIVVPLRPVVLDALLSLNLTISVLLLIVAVYLRHPADFPTFPTIILLGTAFRLALSIATTRQILSEADAGQIIKTFGTFVISGNIAIGLIVFLIITVFQFLVVTKGAERVAEVSARFTLDALPGKQMSIDADLRADAIDKETATERREALARESQFFGAMDGAMKFVKGDAIAGLIIIFINLIGGISVGMIALGFTFQDAVNTYTLLTLGDGLVSQMPALLMALCAGLVTTRVDGSNNIDLGTDIWRDLVQDPRVPAAAAGIVILIGLIPGFPFLNFAFAAGVLLFVSFSVRKALTAAAAEKVQSKTNATEIDSVQASPAAHAVSDQTADIELDEDAPPSWNLNEGPRFERVVLRIGSGLAEELNLPEIDNLIARLLGRYEQTRGLNFDLPHIEIVTSRPSFLRSFELVLDEVPMVTERVPEESFLLRGDESLIGALGCKPNEVVPVHWHEFGGYWVPNSARHSAQDTQSPPAMIESYISTITFRIYETNVGVLFSETQFAAFLAQLEKTSPHQKEQLDARVERTVLFQTLRYLAEDGVPLRPVPLIVDAFLTWIQTHGNVGALELSEYMRGSLKRQICHAMSGMRDAMGVVLLDPAVEQQAREAVQRSGKADNAASTDGLPLSPEVSEALLTQFKQLVRALSPEDPIPVVIASSPIRRRFRNYLSANRISLPVLAPHELSPEINIHPIARIKL